MVTLVCWTQVMPALVTAQMSESTRSALAADSLSLLLPLVGCIELSYFSPGCLIQTFRSDLMEWTGNTRVFHKTICWPFWGCKEHHHLSPFEEIRKDFEFGKVLGGPLNTPLFHLRFSIRRATQKLLQIQNQFWLLPRHLVMFCGSAKKGFHRERFVKYREEHPKEYLVGSSSNLRGGLSWNGFSGCRFWTSQITTVHVWLIRWKLVMDLPSLGGWPK